MDDRPAEQSHRWRPRIRLSVRVLMALVVVIAGGLGWVVHRARVQREAVAAIERAGGRVIYDNTFVGPSFANVPSTPGWKKWLLEQLGIDYFENAESVWLDSDVDSPGRRVNDLLMAEVGKLGRLELLDIEGKTQVTDAGMVHLRGLSQLQVLFLGAGEVHGPGLAHLKGLRRLEMLNLDELDLSDPDLAELAALTSLKHLSISGRRITDTGLLQLAALTKCQALSVKGTNVTEKGVASLKRILPGLQIEQ